MNIRLYAISKGILSDRVYDDIKNNACSITVHYCYRKLKGHISSVVTSTIFSVRNSIRYPISHRVMSLSFDKVTL